VLGDAGLAMSQIEWFLPHQPNGELFKLLVRTLEVDPARTVPVVQDIGSVGAAAVATSLDRLMRTRTVAPGAHVLMASVGAGTAYGALLYREGR
jgi:3-oxoacyl-[acyl-carrier-protein] synthase III